MLGLNLCPVIGAGGAVCATLRRQNKSAKSQQPNDSAEQIGRGRLNSAANFFGGGGWPLDQCFGPCKGVHALHAPRVGYLNTFSRKWSAFKALVRTAPGWGLLREEVWEGVGEHTCNRCSIGLQEDKSLHPNPNFACGYTAQMPCAVSGTALGKSAGANST